MSRALFAEFLGTLLLLAAVVGSGVMGERLAGGNDALALLANSIATGSALFVLITLMGPVSGAHFNPAVSAVACMERALPWRALPAYVAAQLAGGIVGVWLTHAMFALPILQNATQARGGGAQWLSELVASFGLVLTILGGVRHAPAQVAALVAAYISAAYWFTASTSFANPAVTIARALSDTFAGIHPDGIPGFAAAQLLGAALGWWTAQRLGFCEARR